MDTSVMNDLGELLVSAFKESYGRRASERSGPAVAEVMRSFKRTLLANVDELVAQLLDQRTLRADAAAPTLEKQWPGLRHRIR